uniref:Protein tweety homolog n=1 Tax=Melopsittacus undulatus TaxID=13146 RepID=A0A8V5GDJ2_MELUD
MPPARTGYAAPWWVWWLHRLPRRGLRLHSVSAAFRPRDSDYQQSLLFLGLVPAVCLGLNLLFLTVYLICLCCCKRDQDPETKRPHSCCVTWMAVTAGLICCTAVGIGFYGNSETNDGVYQLLYALDHANHTLTGIDSLVGPWGRVPPSKPLHVPQALGQHRAAARGAACVAQHQHRPHRARRPRRLHRVLPVSEAAGGAGDVVGTWVMEPSCPCRWLSYLLFFMLVLTVCLLACLGLAKRSRCLLTTMLCSGLLTLILSWASVAVDTAAAVGTSDFCVAPDQFIMNQTESYIKVVHYYLYCDQGLSNPFQQVWGSLAPCLVLPAAGVPHAMDSSVLWGAPCLPPAPHPQLLNSSETSLHQLTAMLDCRGLHKVSWGHTAPGVLLLPPALPYSISCCRTTWMPSLASATMGDRDYDDMDDEDPFNPQARRIASHNPARGQLRSFCSYSSSLGSQSSLHPPAQTISNAPVSEYM